uniref:Uncharacterized protein n=1 Tax=Glossina pallidipes TaxID=7398 RepID=A0A1B0ADT1_GLOPL
MNTYDERLKLEYFVASGVIIEIRWPNVTVKIKDILTEVKLENYFDNVTVAVVDSSSCSSNSNSNNGSNSCSISCGSSMLNATTYCVHMLKNIEVKHTFKYSDQLLFFFLLGLDLNK